MRVAFEASGAGGAADQDGGGQRAAAGLGEQLRAVGLDQDAQLMLERVDLPCERSDARELLARDAHTRTDGQPSQPPDDAVQAGELVQ